MSVPENHKEIIESFILNYPICEYRFLEREELIFSPHVRAICQTDCKRYGHSWACPPVVGTIEECIERCQHYEHAFLFSTVTDVADSFDMEGCLDARRDHEEVSYQVTQAFKEHFPDVLTLTTGCMICDECAYPDEPCRHPERRFSTIESHGILIMQMAAMQEMNYDCGCNIVTYFSLLLY